MTMVLSGDSAFLRRFEHTDAQSLFLAVRESLAELSPWFGWATDGYCLEIARRFLRDQARWWEG